MFHAVTTMNAAGWEQTGRRMVEAFKAMWPADVELTVYAEGFDPDLPVTVARLPSWVDLFKAKFGSTAYANGMGKGTYDFRWDAVKFAHKVGAITDYGLSHDTGIMIWLDADTFTHSQVTNEWLAHLFPGSSYLAWLDRRRCHPECGFMMFRCEHKAHRFVMESYRDLYVSGRVLALPETHDSYALQHLVKDLCSHRKLDMPVSLSGDRGWHHPFVNGPLGARLDHMKGPRKEKGRSSRRDLRRPRSEPYWQQA